MGELNLKFSVEYVCSMKESVISPVNQSDNGFENRKTV